MRSDIRKKSNDFGREYTQMTFCGEVNRIQSGANIVGDDEPINDKHEIACDKLSVTFYPRPSRTSHVLVQQCLDKSDVRREFHLVKLLLTSHTDKQPGME